MQETLADTGIIGIIISTPVVSVISSILPTLLWMLFALIVFFILKKDLKALLQNLVWRVRTGAALKLSSFELGQSYVSPTASLAKSSSAIKTRIDADGKRYQQREQYYKPNRNIHLVHKLAPSEEPGQLYDIQIYLIPHHDTDATLACVKKVDYYFGRHWGNQIFTSIDRSSGFSISTSAWGVLMCTAEIHYTDGEIVTINRYIDFEMGSIGNKMPKEDVR